MYYIWSWFRALSTHFQLASSHYLHPQVSRQAHLLQTTFTQKKSGWGNCWLSIKFVPGCWCSLLITFCWGFRPSMIQHSVELCLFPKFTQSLALYLTSVCLFSIPGIHWPILTPGLAFFASYYRSQSIPVCSSAGPKWQTSVNSTHGQSEYGTCKASHDGLGLL